MDQPLSGKAEAVVAAAIDLFLKQGFRATSMEAIAREAGVAKPTLYSYFADKNAVFAAAVTWLVGRMRETEQAALEGPGPAAERIAAALVAKFRLMAEVLGNSPHAAELMDEHRRSSGGQIEALEAWALEAFTRAIEEDGQKDARLLAEVIVAGADGIFQRDADPQALERKVRLLVFGVLGA